ncbi:hypothetical protein EAE96_001071 [Botrytis aclada]|nr:hypothetical protein EAE96_001071 [Botrytis aclada]
MPSGAPTNPDRSGIVFRHVWSPFLWLIDVICPPKRLSNNSNCLWSATLIKYPISTQLICKDIIFERKSEAVSPETNPNPLYLSEYLNIIKINPLILPADYAKKKKELGSSLIALSTKANSV